MTTTATLALMLATVVRAAPAQDLSGVYAREGSKGDRVVLRKKGAAYALRWLGSREEAGMALAEGSTLAYGCCDCAESAGLAVFRVEDKRLLGRSASCDGSWEAKEEALSFSRPLAAPPAPRKWKTGDTVLAAWSKDDFWYPATVLELKEGLYLVRFLDGDSELMDASRLIAEDIRVGDRVYARFKDGDAFYPGVVIMRKAQALAVRYYDGTEEMTTLSAVRALRPRADYD